MPVEARDLNGQQLDTAAGVYSGRAGDDSKPLHGLYGWTIDGLVRGIDLAAGRC